ncbi:MAG: hypothetical protein H0V53_07310 [Rubrobacter sp.]|nr:hypothetical protein [Rubrobacter sp.]
MAEQSIELDLPGEPSELRAETRALVEESPADGLRLIEEGSFLAEPLWEEWSGDLREAGMEYERFLGVVRGYAGEARLWVVGERPWEHCVSGLAGRVVRRLPQPSRNESCLVGSEVRG